VHDINAWSLHYAPTQCTLLVELCIVHVLHVRFHVMMWSSDALDPLRRSLRVCASDSISVPCVECTKSWEKLVHLVIKRTCRLSVAIARECRVEVTSHYSPLRLRLSLP